MHSAACRITTRACALKKSRNPVAEREIWRWLGKFEKTQDTLAVEEPLEIRVDTHPISVTMRTPGHDDELAAGFLLTEGIVTRIEDLQRIARDPRNENIINLYLSADVPLDLARLKRNAFVSSSCGLCGKASIESVHQNFPPIKKGPCVALRTLLRLPDRLRESQSAFHVTGGLHAAGLFTLAGELLAVREDIGRHNAVDKILGHALLNKLLPLGKHILLVSGRASFEIMQKALAGHIPVVAAISAPSNLAVEFAEASKQILAGFLRDSRMNIYAGKTRVRR
jgi:FdhD protein